jgi:hypothetical protein
MNNFGLGNSADFVQRMKLASEGKEILEPE